MTVTEKGGPACGSALRRRASTLGDARQTGSLDPGCQARGSRSPGPAWSKPAGLRLLKPAQRAGALLEHRLRCDYLRNPSRRRQGAGITDRHAGRGRG